MFKPTKIIILGLILGVFLISGWLFYNFQNADQLPGGNIALPKLFWLGFVIFYWYIAPVLLLGSATNKNIELLIIGIHLINVWLRAVVELYMMYISNNWHPYYGIAHDIFSFVLIGLLILVFKNRLSNYIMYFLIILCTIFAVETYFASYMLYWVANNAQTVYFVPASNEYDFILTLTWLVVILLSFYWLYFIKNWLTDHA